MKAVEEAAAAKMKAEADQAIKDAEKGKIDAAEKLAKEAAELKAKTEAEEKAL